MPYPKPKPKPLPSEGWNYGYVMATPYLDTIEWTDKKTGKKKSSTVLRVKCITAVPDDNNNVELTAEAAIFLNTGLDEDSENWSYMAFLAALDIPNVFVEVDGQKEEMLPDPAPTEYVGKPVKFHVQHKVWGENENKDAKINRWDSWDGKDPESGEEAKAPDNLVVAANEDDDDDLPF